MRATHVHKYQLVLWGKKETPIYKCVKPGCDHYKLLKLALGALNECSRCGATHPISRLDISRMVKKPHCVSCTKNKRGKKESISIDDVMSKLDALLEDVK